MSIQLLLHLDTRCTCILLVLNTLKALQEVIGHRSGDPPKVHPLKESKLYAMNDGIVDVRALAKSQHLTPTETELPFELTLAGLRMF